MRSGPEPPGPDLVEAVRATVVRHRLLDPGLRVLVAVSGGADSVALLHVLWRLRASWRLELAVAHVHHGLRAAADDDAAFVETLAARLACPVFTERVQVATTGSPEEAARLARHAALGRLAVRLGATRIAMGHTADDQAETVLMRVLQGAGPRGLAGIPFRRGPLIRPLLSVGRAAVRAHLAHHGLTHVEDGSNADLRYLRNRLRHEVLPVLTRTIGNGVPEGLGRTARAARETVEALDALVRPRLERALAPQPGGWRMDETGLADLPVGAARALWRLLLVEHAQLSGVRAVHLDQLDDLRRAPPGSRVRLPGAVVVERVRQGFFLRPGAREAPDPVELVVPGSTWVPFAWLRIEASLEPNPPPALTRSAPAAATEAVFDAGAIAPSLVVRPWRPGDRMPVPGRQEGSVRLSRFLAAAGTARLARLTWPVLAMPTGLPLWLIGLRRGAVAPVTPDTHQVLRLRVVPAWPPRLDRPEAVS